MRITRSHLSFLVLAVASSIFPTAFAACTDDDGTPKLGSPDAATIDAPPSTTGDAGRGDATTVDATTSDAKTTDAGDASNSDGAPDGAIRYSCGAFSESPGWTVAAGFRAVVLAKDNGLNQPVALTFARGPYAGLLYVINQGDNVLRRIDTNTGVVSSFTAAAQWGAKAPVVLTTITWDEESVLDGQLYVGDQGGDGDGDSTIYRVGTSGTASTFVTGPGPGLDDIFGLSFAPKGSAYPQGLYATGDTDGVGVDWGVYLSTVDAGVAFSEVAGSEGISFVKLPSFGGTLLASRPAGGGYAGADEVSRLLADGGLGTPLATTLPGIHAVTYSTGGAFGGNVYVASWSTGKLTRIDSAGAQTELASGLTLTNYDGNILAVSPDGNTMMVADRGANRVVCIEPI
ncbi:MAG: hypothetical protein IPG50_33705 [Myxococcales bacterium]|nr:hypothetical protein [Myxococcales bacterium]